MLQPCAACRRVFNVELAYGQQATAHPAKSSFVCPACWKKSENRYYIKILWTYPLLAFFGLLFWALDRDAGFGWFCLNIALLLGFGLLNVIPHELGHALAGKLVGVRIFQIEIGTGKIIWEKYLLGVRYRIGAIPFGGHIFCLPYRNDWYRIEMLVTILAGPLTNLIIALVAFSFLPEGGMEWVADTEIWPLAAFLFVSNVWSFFYTIYPRSFTTASMGTMRSDGLQIYDLLVKPLPYLSHQRLYFCLYEAEACLSSNDEAGALSWTEKGLSEYPDGQQLLNYQAAALLNLERYAEARAIYLRLLQIPELPIHLKYWVMAFLAYTNTFLEEPGPLEEADAYSAEAFRNQPWEPLIEGLRAIVLNEMGRFEEGIPTLTRLLKDDNLKNTKSFYATFLALAESRRGDKKAALEYFQMARHFDPKSKLLKRVEAELAGGQFKVENQTPV